MDDKIRYTEEKTQKNLIEQVRTRTIHEFDGLIGYFKVQGGIEQERKTGNTQITGSDINLLAGVGFIIVDMNDGLDTITIEQSILN